MTPRLGVFTGQFTDTLPDQVRVALDLPHIIKNTVKAKGFEPTICANSFVRFVLVDEHPIWNWIDEHATFWGSIVGNISMLRAPMWPSYGPIIGSDGRILGDTFVNCNGRAIKDSLGRGCASQMFGFELLRSSSNREVIPTYDFMFGTGIVFPFCYPFLMGSRVNILRKTSRIIKYYSQLGYHVEKFSNLSSVAQDLSDFCCDGQPCQ